jgi:hypothetical protein
MEGVEQLYNFDRKELEESIISKFEVSIDKAKSFNLRKLMSGNSISYIEPGRYIKLIVNGELMMSDTPFEQRTNMSFVCSAKGDVMIAGLGVGLILHNIEDKVYKGEVTSITIYEKYQSVIDLVSPQFSNLPITYVCEDILTYKPSSDEKYDTIYFDIWPTVDYEKNLLEIRMLHNRWKSHKKSKDSWMNSWMKEYMQNERRKYKYEDSRYGNIKLW